MRLAHCLILLLAPAAAQAAEAFDSPARKSCSYAPTEMERAAAPAASATPAATPPATPSKAATPPAPVPAAGGGSDEDVLPRLRAPKWHRLLPGMFR